ncbi:WcaI family glycosyltransferase [Altererythrobacter indicus]|uniref:WcaI family glycosyltransferase n=1 Tax=Altericroceibacterium indicum TaxID=374177 RepID=A0A845AC98_9SPHN|nr:WcaI family glycosyltransferase [Altericroceibacterium indicum]MXP26621.1 WcaI family glycosyltransferase [Altericroceibacterium indicum]
MKVVLLSLNYAPEPIGIGPYSRGTAEALAGAGHKVHVICGKPYYPHWKVAEAYRGGLYRRAVENAVEITRCAHYAPSAPTGLKRLIHHASFALSAAWPLLRYAITQRPDVIMATAPSIIAALMGRVIAFLCGARFWLHVQDFELEAAQATGLLGQGFPALRLLAAGEKSLFKSAHVVSSISSNMCKRLAGKGVCKDRIVEFPNWADDSRIVLNNRNTRLRAAWGVGDRYVALYSGNIGRKQGIGILLQAAKRLQHRRDLVFIICGEGPEKQALEREAALLPNCLIKPLHPREHLDELLATADVFLLPQLAEAADLVLPSKLPNMLAAGRPIIATASEGTNLHDEVSGVGVATAPGNVSAIVKAITDLIDDPPRLEALGSKARERAVLRWGKQAILAAFVAQFTARMTQALPKRRLLGQMSRYLGLSLAMTIPGLTNALWFTAPEALAVL